jgi:hypothetical protein
MPWQKYPILLFVSMFFACAPSDPNEMPEGILPREKMAAIIAEMHLAEASIASSPQAPDSATARARGYYQYIYEKHGSNAEEFGKSYDFYLHHPALLDSIYADIITSLSASEAELRHPVKQ